MHCDLRPQCIHGAISLGLNEGKATNLCGLLLARDGQSFCKKSRDELHHISVRCFNPNGFMERSGRNRLSRNSVLSISYKKPSTKCLAKSHFTVLMFITLNAKKTTWHFVRNDLEILLHWRNYLNESQVLHVEIQAKQNSYAETYNYCRHALNTFFYKTHQTNTKSLHHTQAL